MRYHVLFFSFFYVFSSISGQYNLEILENFDVLKNLLYENLQNSNVSDICLKQWEELRTNGTDDMWQIIDSTSKFPWSGLSVSTIVDWGNYEQCLNVHHKYSGGDIKGKYCPFGFLLPINGVYLLSVCMPNGCTYSDYNAAIKLPLFTHSPCHTRDDLNVISSGDIVFLVFIAVIFIIIAASTGYDVYIKHKQIKSAHPLFLAFSLYTNTRKLIQTSKNHTEQIQIFNGIKTISMAWIIAGHTTQLRMGESVLNSKAVYQKYQQLSTFYLTSAHLGVDAFFYMSGFLIAFAYMKQKTKPMAVQIKSIPLLIIHRYLRLTPAYAMLFFFTITVFKFLGEGPIWPSVLNILKSRCQDHYWTYFTYTQNYANYKEMCIAHTWYLSVDMQLYILSILILIPLSILLAKNAKNFKLVMILCFLVNLFWTLLPLATKLIWTNYRNDYETHSQVVTYTMGITMGIFMRERRDKPFLYGKISKPQLFNLLMWCIILPIMAANAVLYEEYIFTGKHTQTAQTYFSSFYKPIWCISLSWMVYSCYYGYGGIVAWILNRPTLQITAKLSYCMYLLHVLVVIHGTFTSKSRNYFSDYTNFLNWCSYFMITFIVAVIWTLAFESPMITIEKFVFGGGAPKKQNKTKKHSVSSKPSFKQGATKAIDQPTV
ncbi:nose resistant to fluoxetine protein 6-like [Diorhabda sublineata]|uniref:nose resistant to fluoxetine protein 6-like n=1 Tax=Diorhabda sublineata TaxID=1163346 RepID=UPI0024E0B19A|nr:nose resistant to fluoxetine protein 6-like [Diorhabda sublineata]